MTVSIMTLSSIIVVLLCCVIYAECHAECRKFALYSECHYVECRYAECRGAPAKPTSYSKQALFVVLLGE